MLKESIVRDVKIVSQVYFDETGSILVDQYNFLSLEPLNIGIYIAGVDPSQ